MSVGLQLIRALIETRARTEYRQIADSIFVAEELTTWEFVSNYYRRHGQLPDVATMQENGFRLPPAPEPPTYYMDRCRDRAIYNTIQHEQPELARAMQTRDMGAAVEVLQRMNLNAGRMQAAQDVHTLGDVMGDVLEAYEHAHQNPGRQGLTLGWSYLDDLTGGAEPGDVITFVARPGMGKSYLLSHIAREQWLEGANVLFVTMEMTAVQIARRILGIHAGLNPDFIRRGQLSMFTEEAMHQSVEDIRSGAPFHLLSGSFNKSVPLVDAAVQEFAPDVVIIDASYLMQPQGGKGGRKSQWELAAEVGTEIKEMALARNRPVFQSVQFNREAGRSKDPDLIHIGGTDVVGQISTIAVAIMKGDAPHENTRRKLVVMKNREGDVGDMQINFLFDPPDYSFVPEEERTEQNPDIDEWDI